MSDDAFTRWVAHQERRRHTRNVVLLYVLVMLLIAAATFLAVRNHAEQERHQDDQVNRLTCELIGGPCDE